MTARGREGEQDDTQPRQSVSQEVEEMSSIISPLGRLLLTMQLLLFACDEEADALPASQRQVGSPDVKGRERSFPVWATVCLALLATFGLMIFSWWLAQQLCLARKALDRQHNDDGRCSERAGGAPGEAEAANA